MRKEWIFSQYSNLLVGGIRKSGILWNTRGKYMLQNSLRLLTLVPQICQKSENVLLFFYFGRSFSNQEPRMTKAWSQTLRGASTLVNHSYAHIQGYLNIYITRCRIFTGKRGGLGNLESCHRKKIWPWVSKAVATRGRLL